MQMCTESENPHFFAYIFSTWISHLLWHLPACKFVCIFLRYIWREGCLKILIYDLVFVLLYVEGGNNQKNTENINSYPFFVII